MKIKKSKLFHISSNDALMASFGAHDASTQHLNTTHSFIAVTTRLTISVTQLESRFVGVVAIIVVSWPPFIYPSRPVRCAQPVNCRLLGCFKSFNELFRILFVKPVVTLAVVVVVVLDDDVVVHQMVGLRQNDGRRMDFPSHAFRVERSFHGFSVLHHEANFVSKK